MLKYLVVTALTIGLISCHHQSVIIIGAGSSGIAAATRLLANNISDITILEAENRIGGRVHTAPCGDHHVVELGAEWLHGKSCNVVYEMMKNEGVLSMLSDKKNVMDAFFSNGKSVGQEMCEDIFGMFIYITNTADAKTDKGKTAAEGFLPAYTAMLKQKFHDDPDKLAIGMKTFPLMEHVMELTKTSFTWHDPSMVTNYEECAADTTSYFTTFKDKGYQQIFDIMTGKIPGKTPLPLDDKIHLKKVVSKINYSGVKPVVTCTDGSEHTADYVVFTPSLGVLKHDHKAMFEPSLPEDKVAAINDLGIEAVFKVVMHYNSPWWTEESCYKYNFVYNAEDDKEIAKLFPKGPMKDGKSWVSSMMGFTPSEHNPNTATAWFTGPVVPELENLSEKTLQKGINFVLNKFLGGKFNITKPDKLTKTNWYKNPHFRGVTSFETLKSQRDNGECVHMILAKPLKNKDGHEVVLFAGEATHMTHYATVHGAVESGYREADRIIKMHIDN